MSPGYRALDGRSLAMRKAARRSTRLGGRGLFNHLVGLQVEKWFWDRRSHGVCGLEVDDQMKFGRELNRQIARFSAVQNTVDIGRGIVAMHLGHVCAVR